MPPDGPAGPVRRGRRDPEIAAALEAEMAVEDQLNDETAGEGGAPDEGVFLFPGDVVSIKVTHAANFDSEDSWYAYGIQTRVGEHESEQDVFERASTIVNTRVLDLVATSEESVLAMREAIRTQSEELANERRRTRRITPREG